MSTLDIDDISGESAERIKERCNEVFDGFDASVVQVDEGVFIDSGKWVAQVNIDGDTVFVIKVLKSDSIIDSFRDEDLLFALWLIATGRTDDCFFEAIDF